MEDTKYTFTVKFLYDDKKFQEAMESHNILDKLITSEFVRLRNIACDELNQHYEEWNTEFGDHEVPEDDELKNWGGTEYCNFIRSKHDPILNAVNEKYARNSVVELYSDEICDIGGVIRAKYIGGYDHDVKFVAELIPYNK